MDVYEAVRSRRAVRGFKDNPVSREVLERVLAAAAWSPSGSNIQPWNIYVLTGAPLVALKTHAVERVAHGDPWDERQYEMYPTALKSPYGERRAAFGKDRYSALGIAREDWEARQRAAIANWNCFGAPAALFCYIDRDLGRPQWADVGMYLQTVMLLLRAEGLHSCPQMAWSQVRETVAEFLSPPDRLILFCGMSIGYEDPTVSYARTGRAALNETVTFLGDSEIALRAPQLDQTNHLHLSQNEGMVGLIKDDGQADLLRSNRMKVTNMKIVVIGGSGLIGSKLVTKLREHGHEAIAASPNSGVNTLTSEGLAEVLQGASVVIDVSNSPSWEDAAVLNFFETSTRNLLKYGGEAGVKHLVALSVVGTDRLAGSGYFRAKIAQEKLIKNSSIPYSIVQATQFFEFLKQLADISFDGKKVRVPDALFQPMAADDVASAVGRVAAGQPLNGTVEVGGPEQFRMDELVRRRLAPLNDAREVIADPNAHYSGAKIGERTLVPDKDARLGETRFTDWLKSPASQPPSAKLPSPAGATATNRV